MKSFDYEKTIKKVEKSVRSRFWFCISFLVLLLLGVIGAFYFFLINNDFNASQFFQLVGTSVLGVGIAVGLFSSKASAQIHPATFSDEKIKKLREKFSKDLELLYDYSILLTLIGTLYSGFSPWIST